MNRCYLYLPIYLVINEKHILKSMKNFFHRFMMKNIYMYDCEIFIALGVSTVSKLN